MIRIVTKEMYLNLYSVKDLRKYSGVSPDVIEYSSQSTAEPLYLVYSELDGVSSDIPFIFFESIRLILTREDLSEIVINNISKDRLSLLDWEIIKISDEPKYFPLHVYRKTSYVSYNNPYQAGNYKIKNLITQDELEFSIKTDNTWSWDTTTKSSWISNERKMKDLSKDSDNEYEFIKTILKNNGDSYKIINIEG